MSSENAFGQLCSYTKSTAAGSGIYKRKELDRYMAEWFRQWICVCNDFVASSSPGNTILFIHADLDPRCQVRMLQVILFIYVESTTVGKGTY